MHVSDDIAHKASSQNLHGHQWYLSMSVLFNSTTLTIVCNYSACLKVFLNMNDIFERALNSNYLLCLQYSVLIRTIKIFLKNDDIPEQYYTKNSVFPAWSLIIRQVLRNFFRIDSYLNGFLLRTFQMAHNLSMQDYYSNFSLKWMREYHAIFVESVHFSCAVQL